MTLKVVPGSSRAASRDDLVEGPDRQSEEPVIRMPVDIRSFALTVLAVIAVLKSPDTLFR